MKYGKTKAGEIVSLREPVDVEGGFTFWMLNTRRIAVKVFVPA